MATPKVFHQKSNSQHFNHSFPTFSHGSRNQSIMECRKETTGKVISGIAMSASHVHVSIQSVPCGFSDVPLVKL
jgi:hypothetical protein